ncbi:MAG: CHAD domain-containing protein [Gammaproteobacteria bacterium]|nr:CHAD domain-containing protein [Gammaproteobacteria bacterium]
MSEFFVPGTVTIAEFKDRLKAQFPIMEGAALTVERHYQDTFDWRLYKKNYQYYIENTLSGTHLTLSSLHDNRQLFALLLSSPPVIAGDIQSVVLRKRLAPLLGIRALVNKLSVQIRRYPFQYIDEDKKTRAYVYLEDYRLVLDNGKTQALDKRVRVETVKGYEKDVKQIYKTLKTEFKFNKVEQSIFKTGMETLNIHPGEYSSQLDTQLAPGARSDQSLKEMLLASLDIIEANEDGTIKDIDTEFLHDFRVAVRRTRSLLEQIEGVFPRRILEPNISAFKWLGSITGPTRDMDVYLLKFDKYQQALAKDKQAYLEPLHDYLIKHHRIEQKELVKQLKTARYRNLKKKWREFLQTPVVEHTRLPIAKQSIKETADIHIWKAIKRVIKQGNAITEKCPDEKLHRLRLSCKKLRYLLEFFQSLYPASKMKRIIKSLKQLQEILGDFQDLSVQIDSFHDMEIQMQAEGMMTAETFVAMELLVDHFHSQIKSQRALFTDSYSAFSTKANQVLFKKMFKPVKDKVE